MKIYEEHIVDPKQQGKDRRKMIVISSILSLGMLLALHYAFFGQHTEEESAANAPERTSASYTFVTPQESAVEVTKSPDSLAVPFSRKMPRMKGTQYITSEGKLVPDLVDVAVMNENGKYEIVSGKTARGQAELLSPSRDENASVELILGTKQVTSPIPSDNQQQSTVEIPLD